MSDDMSDDIVSKAVAMADFPWVPGIRRVEVCQGGDGWRAYAQPVGVSWQGEPHGGYVAGRWPFGYSEPDLTDGPTVGAMLEALGWPRIELTARRDAQVWRADAAYATGALKTEAPTKTEAIGRACCALAVARGGWR